MAPHLNSCAITLIRLSSPLPAFLFLVVMAARLMLPAIELSVWLDESVDPESDYLSSYHI